MSLALQWTADISITMGRKILHDLTPWVTPSLLLTDRWSVHHSFNLRRKIMLTEFWKKSQARWARTMPVAIAELPSWTENSLMLISRYAYIRSPLCNVPLESETLRYVRAICTGRIARKSVQQRVDTLSRGPWVTQRTWLLSSSRCWLLVTEIGILILYSNRVHHSVC